MKFLFSLTTEKRLIEKLRHLVWMSSGDADFVLADSKSIEQIHTFYVYISNFKNVLCRMETPQLVNLRPAQLSVSLGYQLQERSYLIYEYQENDSLSQLEQIPNELFCSIVSYVPEKVPELRLVRFLLLLVEK